MMERRHTRALPLLACVPLGLTAAWMLIDGSRALLLGDYVTPASGPHAGRLGPWADLLRWIGLEPRSTAVKLLHVAYGSLALAAVARFVLRPSARRQPTAAAVLGMWYLPFGTVLNGLTLLLLALPSVRRERRVRPGGA